MGDDTNEVVVLVGKILAASWKMEPGSVRATLHPDAPAALELSIARTRVLDYL